MSPVEMRTNGFEWCSKTYLGSSRAVRVQIMNSILKLVNTFCMPGSGRGGREEKTARIEEMVKLRHKKAVMLGGFLLVFTKIDF